MHHCCRLPPLHSQNSVSFSGILFLCLSGMLCRVSCFGGEATGEGKGKGEGLNVMTTKFSFVECME